MELLILIHLHKKHHFSSFSFLHNFRKAVGKFLLGNLFIYEISNFPFGMDFLFSLQKDADNSFKADGKPYCRSIHTDKLSYHLIISPSTSDRAGEQGGTHFEDGAGVIAHSAHKGRIKAKGNRALSALFHHFHNLIQILSDLFVKIRAKLFLQFQNIFLIALHEIQAVLISRNLLLRVGKGKQFLANALSSDFILFIKNDGNLCEILLRKSCIALHRL